MATKQTPYILGTATPETDRGRRVMQWVWIVAEPSHGCSWHWTGQRKAATRWRGRAEAQAFADAAMASLASQGYSQVKILLVPASGGIPVGAPIL